MAPQPTIAAAALVCTGALLFGSKGVLIKLCYPYGVSPIGVLCLRLVVALPCFLALAWWERRRAGAPLTWRQRWACIGIGLLGYHVASWLDFAALARLSVGLERMILFAFPTFVVLLPAVWFRRWPEPVVLVCLAVTYVGIVLSYAGDAALGPNAGLGVVLVLLAAFTFSIAYLASATYTRRLGSRRFTAAAMTAAAVGTLTHGLVAEGVAVLHAPAAVWGWAVLLGLGATVLATLCMNEGVRQLGAQRAAVLSSVSPVMAIVLAWVVLGETPTVLQGVGMLVTIVGVTVLAVARQREPAPKPA